MYQMNIYDLNNTKRNKTIKLVYFNFDEKYYKYLSMVLNFK